MSYKSTGHLKILKHRAEKIRTPLEFETGSPGANICSYQIYPDANMSGAGYLYLLDNCDCFPDDIFSTIVPTYFFSFYFWTLIILNNTSLEIPYFFLHARQRKTEQLNISLTKMYRDRKMRTPERNNFMFSKITFTTITITHFQII